MLTPFLSGFFLGGGLIIAIGAQNAYVLRQGLLKNHVFWICLFCAVSDATLIAAGVAGFGAIVQSSPALLKAVALFGAAFLFWYGITAFRRALHPGTLEAAASAKPDLKTALATMAAFTFLNPHVYLDTVVLVGGYSAQYPDPGRLVFGLGAAAASFVWFFGLGYGARLLEPLFRKPMAWRALDTLIGSVMWLLAFKLVQPFLPV
jgi:L-lysine exporter family protein LysE/ArgO